MRYLAFKFNIKFDFNFNFTSWNDEFSQTTFVQIHRCSIFKDIFRLLQYLHCLFAFQILSFLLFNIYWKQVSIFAYFFLHKIHLVIFYFKDNLRQFCQLNQLPWNYSLFWCTFSVNYHIKYPSYLIFEVRQWKIPTIRKKVIKSSFIPSRTWKTSSPSKPSWQKNPEADLESISARLLE